jgi:hypothetical protein
MLDKSSVRITRWQLTKLRAGAKEGLLKYFFKVATPELTQSKEGSFSGIKETGSNK